MSLMGRCRGSVKKDKVRAAVAAIQSLVCSTLLCNPKIVEFSYYFQPYRYIAMATPAPATASKPSADSPPPPAAATMPTSPTIPISPTSILSPTEMGWKITITNSDGTSNELTLEPKVPEHTGTNTDVTHKEYADPEKAPDSAGKKTVKASISSSNEFYCTALLTLITAIAKTRCLPHHSIHP
jgi:hypothetical protein